MADPKAPMRGHKATFANFLRRKCINNNIVLRLRQFFLLKKNKFHYVLTPPNPHSVKYLLYIRPVHPTQTWWIHKIEKSKNSKFTLCFCFHCLPRVLKKQTKNITKVIDLICLIISSLNVVGKKKTGTVSYFLQLFCRKGLNIRFVLAQPAWLSFFSTLFPYSNDLFHFSHLCLKVLTVRGLRCRLSIKRFLPCAALRFIHLVSC